MTRARRIGIAEKDRLVLRGEGNKMGVVRCRDHQILALGRLVDVGKRSSSLLLRTADLSPTLKTSIHIKFCSGKQRKRETDRQTIVQVR